MEQWRQNVSISIWWLNSISMSGGLLFSFWIGLVKGFGGTSLPFHRTLTTISSAGDNISEPLEEIFKKFRWSSQLITIGRQIFVIAISHPLAIDMCIVVWSHSERDDTFGYQGRRRQQHHTFSTRCRTKSNFSIVAFNSPQCDAMHNGPA